MVEKPKFRSRIVVEGIDRTPHRALRRACGLDDGDLDKPLIGIVSTQGENTPCSMSLAPQADAARLGVAAGGAVPVPFTTISVSDGVSMNHKGMRLSLVSREISADSIEAVMRAHAYDGLIGFAGCDKPRPAIMRAMFRLNAPSAFVYGGAMLPGRWRGRDATVLTAYEAVGTVLAGGMTEAELASLERSCAPTGGSCPGQWWRRRWVLRRRARPCCPRSTPSGWRWRAAPAAASPRSSVTAARCRAIWSPASRWRMQPRWSPRPAGRPMPRCICRRSPTRPAFVSRLTTSPRCLPGRR